MIINYVYYPLGQYIITICVVLIVYINVRKHGLWLKHNQLLTYLVLIIGTPLVWGDGIFNSQNWFTIINPFILTFMCFNKYFKAFRKNVRNYLNRQ